MKISLICLTLIGGFILSFKIGLFFVVTGSMEPLIKKNTLVITYKQKSYTKGDIIAFLNPQINVIYIHRIIDINFENSDQIYKTKGDKNPTDDKVLVKSPNIKGKVFFIMPLI